MGQRTALVVDLDGEPLAPLRALEEILPCLGTWEDDDLQERGTDTEFRLPEPLADRVALAAVQRLLSALAPTQSRGPGCDRLLAPDGRYEHAPLTVLTLPAADIEQHPEQVSRAMSHVLSRPVTIAEPSSRTRRRIKGRADC